MRIAANVRPPLLVATIWATIVHGTAIPSPVRLVTEVALFAAAYIGLCAIRRLDLAAKFAGAVTVKALLMVAWGQ